MGDSRIQLLDGREHFNLETVDLAQSVNNARWKRCEDCPWGSWGRAVGWRGNPNAEIALVLESPGREEMLKQIPIVGPTGKLTQYVLPVDDVDEHCFVTNSLRCMPPKDAKDQSTMKPAVAACRSRLLAELQMAPRRVILAFGAGALWGVTGNFNLKPTVERGHIFSTPYASEGMLATIHPAYLMRGGGSLRQLKDDVARGFDLAKGIRPTPILDVTWEEYTSPEQISEVVKFLLKQPLLAADIETTGLDFLNDEVIALGIAYAPHKVVIFPREVFRDPEALRALRPLFNSPKIRWLWHNGKFDIKFLRRKDYALPARVDEDTMLLSYARDENKGLHDLETLGNDVIGWPPYKHMMDQYTKKGLTYADAPREHLHKYLAFDCSSTLQVFPALKSRIEMKKPERSARLFKLYYSTLIPASEFFTQTETRGMLVDLEAWGKADAHLKTEISKYRKELREISGKPDLNPNSPPQVSEVIYQQFGLELENRPNERGTDKDILEKLPDHPFVRALLKYRTVAKAHGTYIGRWDEKKKEWKGFRRWVNKDGRVHSTVLLHGTTTGRPASREPNILNIPRDPMLRGIFCAPEGYVLVANDVSQAELRVLAMCSGDEYLTQLYIDGTRKLHDEMAEFLFGDRWLKEIDKYRKEQLKMRAKAVNFGIPYGRTAQSIAYEFGVPVHVAQSWIDAWFERAPGAKAFIERCREAPLKGELIYSRFGQERRLGVVSNGNIGHIQNEASNFPIQHISNHIVLHTGMKAQPILKKEGIHIVNFIYDDILTECPNEPEKIDFTVNTVSRCLDEVIDEWFDTEIPFIMESKVSTHWGDPDAEVKQAA